MKISVSWVFEHIAADWQTYSVKDLVQSFTQTTAEIENFYPLQIPLESLFLVRVIAIQNHTIVDIPELQQQAELPVRTDAHKKDWFLIKKVSEGFVWAGLRDFGHASSGDLMPALQCAPALRSGAWKKQIVAHDYIIDVNNTAITNRPDLWGARGIACEFAAIIDKPLIPIKKFLRAHTLHEVSPTDNLPFSIANRAPDACKQFAGLYLQDVHNTASPLAMALRLCSIDQRPIDALVDTTNYVMFDLSQPMHAFDAAHLAHTHLEPRKAQEGTDLTLLDGTTIKLSAQDLIISDGTQPVSLAGIMGGAQSAVNASTKNVLIESAIFDGATVRLSAARHKLRTQASIRFEKELDETQNITALQRLLKILKQAHVPYNCTQPILCVTRPIKSASISCTPDLFDHELGVHIAPAFVKKTLKKIGFHVHGKNPLIVDVPSWRATKDITQPCDVVEEIGRFYGYNNIPKILPTRAMTTNDNSPFLRRRKLKQHCAFGMHMHEVYNYPFFNETWLARLHYNPEQCVIAKNPLSRNVTRLVTSLIPHLLQNVEQNIHKATHLQFFELNRTWHMHEQKPQEHLSLAGVMWQPNAHMFYQSKSELTSLFNVLGLKIYWEKPSEKLAPWYDATQTAVLRHNKKIIGLAGMLDMRWAGIIGNGNAFIFELDAHYLCTCPLTTHTFVPLSPYPYLYFDVSMLAPLTLTVAYLQDFIKTIDPRIYSVQLIDLFNKKEWENERSLTFRYFMRDEHKTLTKSEGDEIHARVVAALQTSGATIR